MLGLRWRRRQAHELPAAVPCEELPAEPSREETPPDPGCVDGAVWVEGGVLKVRNPTGLGRWPSVRVQEGQGVELWINGERHFGEVVVQAEDRVELRCEERTEPARVDVEVSADGLSVWVTVRPAERIIALVPDTEPAVQLPLSPILQREPVGHGLSPGDVREALARAGVRVDPDEAAIEAALAAPGQRTMVATGRLPSAGRPGRVWTAIHGVLEQPPAANQEGGGPWERRERIVVRIGDPVAQILTAGEPSLPGLAVTGESIPAPPVWCPALVPGPGVVLSADGTTAIAALAGHPEVEVGETCVRIAVLPETHVRGDVDDGTGDLHLEGNVWIEGDVLPGRTVRASGYVEVAGRVTQARIEAGGAIRVHGGAANATLIAGGPGLVYARAAALCEELIAILGHTSRTLGGEEEIPWRRVRGLVRQICDELARAEGWLDAQVRELYEELLEFLSRQTPTQARIYWWDGLPDATALTRKVKKALDTMWKVLEFPGNCHVRHLDHCRVEATGDVEVAAPGALHSHITTLGVVRIRGALRGGSVWALRGAEIETVGWEDGVVTRVEVGRTASLRAEAVKPGAVLVRGEVTRNFDRPARHVVWEREGAPPAAPAAVAGRQGD